MNLPQNLPEIHPVLDFFTAISAIPRCSGQEKGIASWLWQWSQERGLESIIDAAGNVLIRVPASPGKKSAPAVILQTHMDMVCEKDPASDHDFSRDPLQLIVEGDWLSARGTSLGADDGLGMALALALATDRELRHPELELLFTVEEETGMAGARNLDTALLKGRLLINIDSEKEGVFTIGCAGSKNLCLELPVEREPLPNGWPTATLTVTGLRGGHSGMNIAEGRGNANKILAEMLEGITAATEIRLLSLQGGTRANAIPRQAEAVIAFPPQAAATVQKQADQFAKKAAERFGTTEPELTVALVPGPRPQDAGQALDGGSTMQCLRLLAAIPHGVIRMGSDRPDTVATSNNLALVRIEQERMKVLCLPRSIRMEELDTFEKKMAGTAAHFNARFSVDGRYPAWEPDPASLLLGHCLAVYRRTFGREAVLHVTHGGLECGIFSARLPGVELVSLGPDMENAHSPDERAFLPSIIKVQRFLKTLLESLG